jgi:hypothetical protein
VDEVFYHETLEKIDIDFNRIESSLFLDYFPSIRDDKKSPLEVSHYLKSRLSGSSIYLLLKDKVKSFNNQFFIDREEFDCEFSQAIKEELLENEIFDQAYFEIGYYYLSNKGRIIFLNHELISRMNDI